MTVGPARACMCACVGVGGCGWACPRQASTPYAMLLAPCLQAVYERRAPAYAVESAEWSGVQEHTDRYEADGCRMTDVLADGR